MSIPTEEEQRTLAATYCPDVLRRLQELEAEKALQPPPPPPEEDWVLTARREIATDILEDLCRALKRLCR